MFVLFRPGEDVWAYGVEPAKVKYRLRLARYPALAEYLTEWLVDRETGSAGQKERLLDIGAGFGRTFVYLQAAGIDKAFELKGIDIEPDRKKDVYANSCWDISQADAQEPLQFEDNSFDVVVCEQLLEHIHNPNDLIREIHRVLKPGGLFICGVPVFPEPIAAFRRWMVGRYGLRGSDHIQTYSLRSIRRDLKPFFSEQDTRGFRVISGGLLRKLENHEWWYRFNRKLGVKVPALCVEVQMMVTANKV